MLERPPAKAVKKNSGKTSDGSSRDGFVSTLCSVRHATPRATDQVLTAEPPNSQRFDRSFQTAARDSDRPRRQSPHRLQLGIASDAVAVQPGVGAASVAS